MMVPSVINPEDLNQSSPVWGRDGGLDQEAMPAVDLEGTLWDGRRFFDDGPDPAECGEPRRPVH